jgi:oligopeptide transport system substrate-binding protein
VEALGDKFGQAAGASQMVTSGPFTISEWAPKDHITLVRNDNYTVGHTAYLSQVTMKFISDTNQAYNAFQAGQLDLATVPASIYPSVKSDANVHQEPEFGTRWITVDVTIPPWNNKDFVIGINQATDREAIARDVYFGVRQAWAAPCAAAVFGCDPKLFSNLEFNLDKAKASIKKAYPNGNIPAVNMEGVDDPTVKALLTTLQSQWAKVGVTVNTTTTDQKTLQADMRNHVSGTQITGWSMDFADATDLWSIKTKAAIGATNFGFYDRPQYDQLVVQQDQTLDASQRTALLKQIQQFYAADPADITFAVQLRTEIINPKIKGLILSPFDYNVIGDQHLSDIYVSK